MREIKLVNQSGREYSLAGLDTGLFKRLKGVGFAKDYSYTRNGNKWVRNKLDTKQEAISGDIVIASRDPYREEAQFLQFLRESQELRVVYTTSQGTWYKEVDLVSYGKTEISKGALSCPVVFMPLSHWQTENSIRVVLEQETSDEKYYNDEYAYDYVYNDYSNGRLQVVNRSSLDATFTVTFEGPITNPNIVVMHGEEEIGEISITANCIQGESIEYSYRDGEDEMYCVMRSEGTETNLVPGFDITKTNWFGLPPGENEFILTADSAILNPVTVVMYESYEVV